MSQVTNLKNKAVTVYPKPQTLEVFENPIPLTLNPKHKAPNSL